MQYEHCFVHSDSLVYDDELRLGLAPFMMKSWLGSTFFVIGTVWGVSTCGFPSQRASSDWQIPLTNGAVIVELWCLLCSYSKQAVEQTVEQTVIWEVMILMWCHCNVVWDVLKIKDKFKKFLHVVKMTIIRDDSRLAPSQWETLLQSKAVSHWLAANLKSALIVIKWNLFIKYLYQVETRPQKYQRC